jgi:pilus assembly protein CpaB
MGNLKAVIPIAVSLIIAIAGSWFLYQWIERQRAPKEVVKVMQADAVPIAVATANLPWGTKLKPEMIKTAPYLKESLPTGYFANLQDLNDRVIITPLRANDPITEHHLAPVSVTTGGVSAVLPAGKRAVAVKGDKVIGISGLINPGNRVDVLVTIEDPQKKEERTKIILENVLVLATGTQIQKNEKGEPSPVDVYTLEVTPEESERLTLGATEGKLQLALRPVTDSEIVLTPGINVQKMLAAYAGAQPEAPKPAAPAPEPKVVKWAPRSAVKVEIIKGNETSQKSF